MTRIILRSLPRALLAAALAGTLAAPSVALAAAAYQFSVKILAPSSGAAIPGQKVVLIGKLDSDKADQVRYLVDESSLRSVPVKNRGFSQVLSLTPGKHDIKVSAVGHNADTIGITVGKPPAGDERAYQYHPGVETGECDDCHAARGKGKKVTQAVQCGGCHQGVDTARFLHGPMGAGECTPCHDPHGSSHKAMTRGEDRELCNRCHEPEETEAHYKETKRLRCLNCHNPHGTDKKFHLR